MDAELIIFRTKLTGMFAAGAAGALLDFRFFEFDVLLDHRIIFLKRKLLRQIPRVLNRHVVITRSGGAY